MNRVHLERSEQAAHWVARMDAGEWTPADEAELQRWLALDPLHAGALLQAQAAWAMIEAAPAVETAPASTRERLISRRRLAAFGGTAIAASLVGGLIFGPRSTDYATGVGEIRRVPLADGSIATINTASNVEIAFADTRRAVRIGAGEAWFQVAKDPARPFVVEAGRVRVQAVGTAFSVHRKDAGAVVLVTEGVVEVWVEGEERTRLRVEAGSRAVVSEGARIVREQEGPSSVDRALAWRSGKIDLLGVRLDHAAEEFNRYNHRRLVIADPSLAAEELDGVFGIDDPEGFAMAASGSLGVALDLSDPREIKIGE